MNKITAVLFSACFFVFLACSSDDGGEGDDKYAYCVFMGSETCLSGSFTAATCKDGGFLSQNCPFEAASLPSSSSKDGNSSSDGSSNAVYGTPVTYQNETYPIVVIGTQTWFAKNLNYAVEGSKCYNNQDNNCNAYGRLYNWDAAMAACPNGWNLPSRAEWDVLINFVGGKDAALKKLKAVSGWNDNGNGTDDYGFAALPSGEGWLSNGNSGNFATEGIGSMGFWWSATATPSGVAAYDWFMGNSTENTGWGNQEKENLFSVRCIKDSNEQISTTPSSSSNNPSSSSENNGWNSITGEDFWETPSSAPWLVNKEVGNITLNSSGGVKFSAVSGSSEGYYLQLKQSGHNVKQGDCLAVCLWGSTTAGTRDIQIGFQQNGGSYSSYYAEDFTCGTLGCSNIYDQYLDECKNIWISGTDSDAVFYINAGYNSNRELILTDLYIDNIVNTTQEICEESNL